MNYESFFRDSSTACAARAATASSPISNARPAAFPRATHHRDGDAQRR